MLGRGAAYCSSPSISPRLNRLLRLRVLVQAKTQPTSDSRLPHGCRSAPDARAISTFVFPSSCSRVSSFSPSLILVPTSHMATLTARRPHSTQSKGKEPQRSTESHDPNHDHSNDPHTHSHSHSHSHSHGFLGSFAHSHDHSEEEHSKDAEQIVQALKGQGTCRVGPFYCAYMASAFTQPFFDHLCLFGLRIVSNCFPNVASEYAQVIEVARLPLSGSPPTSSSQARKAQQAGT